ncbi:MAG TPA: lactonase family protein [Blastocatellia bacterium]|nr:lactonase family protein [Blastocatellia bacterium]
MPEDDSTRRQFLGRVGSGTLGLALSRTHPAWAHRSERTQELLVYVGTYTTGKSEGIYLFRLNLSSGELTHVNTTTGVVNPSYLTLDPQRRYLYVVNEVTDFRGETGGALSAFAINRKTHNLQLLNQQPSLGGAPCYVTVDAAGRFVLVANYLGGNVSVFPIQRDGRLGGAVDMDQHQGSSVNPNRQNGPHAHSIVLDPANRHAYSCNLGTDKIMIYRFDSKKGTLTANQQPWVGLKPGAGPRHFSFHPSGRFGYVINELDATITSFHCNPATGTLKETQTVRTLPEGFSGTNTTADIHVSPSGKFLYGSNRGHNSIVVFEIEDRTGKLKLIEHVETGGRTPRNFALDPTGTFLLVANQDSDTIVTFSINPSTGRLKPTGKVAQVPSPVCLKLFA